MLLYLLTFVLALLLALYGVPVARRAALQFNVVDRPDGRLKHQAEPVRRQTSSMAGRGGLSAARPATYGARPA